MIDSGGFTNYWNGIKNAATGKNLKKINIDEYVEFCHKIDNKVFGYIQLDKPRDAVESQRLLKIQTDAGLHPMPVFVQGMDWTYLPELLKINRRVCVSAGWQSNIEYSYQRYQKAYKLTNGKILSHALAWGRYPQILGLPIASADSSTWINGSRYGVIMVFDRVKGLITVNKERVKTSFNSPHVSRIMSRLMNYNVTVDDLNDSQQWRGNSYRGSITQSTHTLAFLQAMKYIKTTANIDYFIVIPGLSKNTHFAQFNAVLASIQDNGLMDYQQYKSEIAKIEHLSADSFMHYSLKAIERFDYIT